MSKIETNNFEFLGFPFQLKLLAAILNDAKFATRIMEVMEPNFFKDPYFKIIALTIKDAFEAESVNLDITSLETRLLGDANTTSKQEYVIAYLDKLKKVELVDIDNIKIQALKFCRQRTVERAMAEVGALFSTGDLDNYHAGVEKLYSALSKGDRKDDDVHVLDNIDKVLSKDYRKPIPTGVAGLDAIMNGGLSKGELGIVLAAYGVGKTTALTKFANSAYNLGYNVVQIFFEDLVGSIQRKHYACWSDYKLSELEIYSKEVIEIVKQKQNPKGGLRLKKFPSDGTTIPIIKSYLKRLINSGFIPDIILIDYIDCIQPSKKIDDQYVGEGNVMREFETMLGDLDIAGWTATQGNRSSIDAAVVGGKEMGGSIKKGQIGHFVVSIAKDPDQKDNGTATMAIIKSRFGKSGKIFEHVTFDNERIQIDLGVDAKSKSVTEFKSESKESEQRRVNAALEASKNRNAVLGTDNNEINALIGENNNTNNIG